MIPRMFSSVRTAIAVASIVLLSACSAAFNSANYTSSQAIYAASLAALEEGRHRFAIGGFERLTLTLGIRDSLLPRAHFYLGMAHKGNKDFLMAAESFRRVHGLFSSDSLADDALFQAALAYRELWPNPELDATYGEAARQTLQTLLTSYPTTSLREDVFRESESLDEDFATKDFNTAQQYFRTRVFGAAVDYSRSVVDKYPATRVARDARVLIIRSYQKLGWDEEVRDECIIVRQIHRDDPQVISLCGGSGAGGGLSR